MSVSLWWGQPSLHYIGILNHYLIYLSPANNIGRFWFGVLIVVNSTPFWWLRTQGKWNRALLTILCPGNHQNMSVSEATKSQKGSALFQEPENYYGGEKKTLQLQQTELFHNPYYSYVRYAYCPVWSLQWGLWPLPKPVIFWLNICITKLINQINGVQN